MKNTRKHIAATMGALTLLIGTPMAAQATVVTYSSEAAFKSVLNNPSKYYFYGTDTFNNLAADVDLPAPVRIATGNSFKRSAGGYTYSLNVGTWYDLFNNTSNSVPTDVRISPENAARALNFDTFNKVYALGANFFITDVFGDFLTGQSVKLTLTDTNNLVTNLTLTNTLESTYRGFASTVALKSLSVIAASPLDDNWATMDNLTLATVPEPATLALFGLAAAGLLSTRRRIS